MPTSLPIRNPSAGAERGRLTGRKVLLIFCAFFGVIFAMNAVFLHLAFSTFGGVEAAGAYRQNFLLTREIAAAERQAEQGWKVKGSVTRNANGLAAISVVAHDRNGAPLEVKSLAVELRRPADRRLDRPVTLQRFGANRFAGEAPGIAAGQWLFVLTLFDRNGERFHSKNRLILK